MWLNLLLELKPGRTWLGIAQQSGVSKHVIYALVEGRMEEPRHSDGVKLRAFYNSQKCEST